MRFFIYHLTQSCTEDTFVTRIFFAVFRFKSNITEVGAVENQNDRNISDNLEYLSIYI